jgi:urease accessory protein
MEARMRQVQTLAGPDAAPTAVVSLHYDERRKSRQRVRADDGGEVALLLPRGTVLRDGDCLLADDGAVILVRAAAEPLSEVRSHDPLQLMRAAYHLGNRHVALQVTSGVLRYQHDHVLDDMARALGLVVSFVEAPFQPEPGAYAGGRAHEHHHHDHDHHDHHHHD